MNAPKKRRPIVKESVLEQLPALSDETAVKIKARENQLRRMGAAFKEARPK